jgi:hypothetical protein
LELLPPQPIIIKHQLININCPFFFVLKIEAGLHSVQDKITLAQAFLRSEKEKNIEGPFGRQTGVGPTHLLREQNMRSADSGGNVNPSSHS